MPVLYKQIPLCHQGMLSALRFDLPGDGRKVFFDISPGGTLRKEIYIVCDGVLRENRFANGSRLDTPVRGVERMLSSPHEAFAIVVEQADFTLDPIPVRLNPIPVTFADGRNAVIKLSGELNASICPIDPALLARHYVGGLVTVPEAAAAAVLKTALAEYAAGWLPKAMACKLPQEALGDIASIAVELGRLASDEVGRKLPWCQVTFCNLDLTVDNIDHIVDKSNTLADLTLETQRKLLDAIIGTFGTSPLPAEVSQVILAYVQSNPGLSAADLQNFCQGIQQLWHRSNPDALLQAARQVGLLPAGKGGR